MRRTFAIALVFGVISARVAAQPPVAESPSSNPPPGPPPIVDVPIAVSEPAAISFLPGSPKPGFFGSVDFSFLFPHRSGDIRGTVPLATILVAASDPLALGGPAGTFLYPSPISSQVALPGAPLDGTLAPTFKVGYRLTDGRGAIQVTYRNLASEGSELIPAYDLFGDGILSSRIDVNEVGVNYSTREHPLGALWAIRWEIGARLSSIYLDSEAFGLSNGQRATSHFIGAGPQLALDVAREIPDTGLALFSRIDGAMPIGSMTQSVSTRLGDPDRPFAFVGDSQSGTQTVPYLGLQAGMSWINRPDGRFRLTAGYEFNQWWNASRLGDSRGYLQAQGLFLRTEYNY